MAKSKLEGNGSVDPVDEHHATDGKVDGVPSNDHHSETNDVVVTAATVGVVAVGVAVFEAALLPGLVLGVAAILAPKYLPKLGMAFNPLFKSTVRNAYRLGEKTREMVAEMQEQVHDIVAEVNAESDLKPAEDKRAANATAAPNA
jgi:hypothetical protein